VVAAVVRLLVPWPASPVARDRAREAALVLTLACEIAWWRKGFRTFAASAVRGLVEARRSGSGQVAAGLRVALGFAVGSARAQRLGARLVQRGLRDVDEAADPHATAWAHMAAGVHLLGNGQWDEARAACERGRAVAGPALLPRIADMCVMLRGVAAYYVGEYREAVAAIRAGAESAAARQDPAPAFWALLVELECALHTDVDAEGRERLLGRARRGAVYPLGRLYALAACHYLAAGDPVSALAEVRRATDASRPRPVLAPYTLEAVAGPGAVLLGLAGEGSTAEIRKLGRVWRRHLRHLAYAFPIARPRRLLHLGLARQRAGRHRLARRAFRRAAELAGRLGMPFEEAYAHLYLARCLGDGDPDTRSGHLDHAHEIFAAIGCKPGLRDLSEQAADQD
jgi:tetratricopeptide (TPR) repeat protein